MCKEEKKEVKGICAEEKSWSGSAWSAEASGEAFCADGNEHQRQERYA